MNNNISNVLGVIGSGIFLWIIASVYPAWVVMLSIVNTFFNWVNVDGTIDSNEYSFACAVGLVIFLILAGIMNTLMFNIRKTWGIVIPIYLICFYPFICWLDWIFVDKVLRESEKLFPGVDWFPWF